jgi:hypothetical protein
LDDLTAFAANEQAEAVVATEICAEQLFEDFMEITLRNLAEKASLSLGAGRRIAVGEIENLGLNFLTSSELGEIASPSLRAIKVTPEQLP